MRKTLLVVFLLMISSALFSQYDTTLYYNNSSLLVPPHSSSWYRKIHYINSDLSIALATDYYLDGSIKRSRGTYIKDATGTYPYGRFTNFYMDGKTASAGSYDYDYSKKIRGQRVGRWTEFYENATEKCDFNYEGLANDYYEEYVLNCWDSSGKQTLTDGNGYRVYEENIAPIYLASSRITINCEYKNGKRDGKLVGLYTDSNKIYCNETYSSGKLIEGTSYDLAGKKYNYTSVEQNPKFPGGDAELMRFLQKNIKYPAYERNNGIMGKVLLRFVVDTDGNITDIQVIRSVSKGLDEESVRIVKLLPRFQPGLQRGQTVNVYFNLPVVYRLQ